METSLSEKDMNQIKLKFELSEGELEYLIQMHKATGDDGLLETFATSIKSMGLEMLEWVEPPDFAASIKLEEERKHDLDEAPKRVIQQYGLTEDEQSYLIKMLADNDDYYYLEAYAESITSIAFEQLEWFDPVDFAASIRLEEQRKIEEPKEDEKANDRPAVNLSKEKQKRAVKPVSRGQKKSNNLNIISSASEYLKKQEKYLEEKAVKSPKKEIVNIKFLRERQGGKSKQQLKQEFDHALLESVKCDVLVEMFNEKIQLGEERLKKLYPKAEPSITQLILETFKTGEDSREANQIKKEIRDIIKDSTEELKFFKNFRDLTQTIARYKELATKAYKYEKERDDYAKHLDISHEVQGLYKAKYPSIKSALQKRK